MTHSIHDQASLWRQCRQCRLYAHSLYLICAVHPAGPADSPCPDFEAATPAPQPLRGGYVSGDWLPMPGDDLLSEEDWLAFWEPEDSEFLF